MRRLLPLLLLLAVPAGADAAYREKQVRAAVTEAGFAGIADRAVRSALPTFPVNRVVLRRTPAQLGSTRLGGPADLPAGARWPACKTRKQIFLGQIRLRDLPRSAGAIRRLGGTLLFFSDIEFEDPSDTEFGLRGGDCNAVVHARRGAPLTRRTEGAKQLRPARLRFATRTDLPAVHMDGGRLNHPLHGVTLTRPQEDAWERMRQQLRPFRSLEHRVLGHFDSPQGGAACWEKVESGWRHLFTLGMDQKIGYEVADGGRIQFAISPADLRRGRFARACGVFDSG